MKTLFLSFFLCVNFIGVAQIDLLFESKLDYSLLIGIDGFIQNPEPVGEAVIMQLDTGLHTLEVLAMGKDTLLFRKEVRLLETDKQRYVLEADFKGNKNLHYRGIVERFPLKAVKIKQQRLLAYNSFIKKHFLPSGKPMDSEKEKTLAATEVLPDKAKATETAKALSTDTPAAQSGKVATVASLKAERDSLNLYARSQQAKLAENAFDIVIAKIKAQDFEFEKLQAAMSYVNANKIKSAEVIELAGLLRFDDSRLQLCTLAKKKLNEKDKEALSAVFQFEYSKNAYLQSLK